MLGVSYDNVTMAEALASIREAVERGVSRRMAFINADCLNKAFCDASYRSVLSHFDRVWADGSGIALAGRMLGSRAGKCTGKDLFPLLCAYLERERRTVFSTGRAGSG